MRPRVSLSMIVKDGAQTLGRCLASVADLVDEMVVVDTGSTDATPAVAAGLGARVEVVPWDDSFAAARNESLRRATGDWVFWLDADEWLDDDGRGRFRALIDRLGAEDAVYFMRQVSPRGGPGAGELVVSQPRLFRNGPDVRWRYRVHEQVVDSCLRRGDQPRLTDVIVHHSGYESADVSRRKEGRNLRLLERERAENPDDSWVLFQLARLTLQDRFPEARAHLLQALQRTGPGDPLRRPLYALLAKGYRAQGEPAAARQALDEGLALYPTDTNLLFESGALAFEAGALDEAAAAFTTLLTTRPDPDEFLGAVDLSLRGWQTRHHLAVIRHRQGRLADAEAQWRAAVLERPDVARLWFGLCELYLTQSRWDDLERSLARLETHAPGSPDVSPDDPPLLRARAHIARREFAPARALLAGVIARHPAATWPRVLLSRAYLLEGDDLDAAEVALRDVLTLDPDHAEARTNLANLLDYLADGDPS